MSEHNDANPPESLFSEDDSIFVDILPVTQGEEPWMLSDKVFTLANGSISIEGLPDELKRLAAEIEKADPLRAAELVEEFADIGREVCRYRQAARNAQRWLLESNREAREANAAVEIRIEELKREMAIAIQPMLDRISRLQEEIEDERRAAAMPKATLRAQEEAKLVSEDAVASRMGLKLPPLPTKAQKAALVVAEVVGGAVVGAQYGLASGKVDLESVGNGDVFQEVILLICVCLGVTAMLCMGYVVSSRFSDARAEKECCPGERGWLAHLGIGFCAIATFTFVETVVVRMGLTNANLAGLMTGNVSAGDLHTLSWVLGVMVSLSVLFAAGTLGWSRLYGVNMRRRATETQAANREDRMSQEDADSARIELYTGQEQIGAANDQVESLQIVVAEEIARFESAIAAEEAKRRLIREAFPAETVEALRRQVIVIAVKLDEAVRRRRALVNALSATPLDPPTSKQTKRAGQRKSFWQRVIGAFRRKRPP